MKSFITLLSFLFISAFTFAQPGKKQKPPSQADINKMIDDATKGMSPEEQAEMKKALGGAMTDMVNQPPPTAYYPEFTNNKELVPKRDAARINAIPKRKLSQADMGGYAGNLYNKIITKGDAAEIAIVKKVIAQTPAANDIGSAAILCMMQGHPQAAMALSMKAVQADPMNVNAQNNMASILTQYGYPDQAIPVLQKLQTQFPDNSTVLNNLAIAWLGLGETDSVRLFSAQAMHANPDNPESMLCGGFMEELFGDPIKATEDYTTALENAPNIFTQSIIKNKNGGSGIEKVDFEKLKKSITIYRYFPKDWIKVPVYSNNVQGYKSDKRIRNGYEKMRAALEEKLEAVANAGGTKLAEGVPETEDPKAEAQAAAGIMNEFSKGVNIMSKTAVTIMAVMQQNQFKWHKDYSDQRIELIEKLNKDGEEMTKCNNCKCPAMDAKNSAFLAYANPIVRKFHEKKIEEFRSWLNAFCTWVWYIDGNPRDIALTHCIAWTTYLFGLYSAEEEDLRINPPACVNSTVDEVEPFAEPEIPNFTCPTTVRIPMGKDWEQLSSAVKNFNGNSYSIKQSGGTPVPNATFVYGIGSNIIYEAKKGFFVKTANGSVLPAFTESEELNSLNPTRKEVLIIQLLQKMLTADCKKVKSPEEVKKEAFDRIEKVAEKLLPEEFQEIKKNGLQTTINSGVQAPGTFTPKPGLFK
jgi:tetratricopeptide (TPR) repeat protein